MTNPAKSRIDSSSRTEDKLMHVIHDLYRSKGIQSLLLSCEILNELLLHDSRAVIVASNDKQLLRFIKSKKRNATDGPLLGQLRLLLMLLGQIEDSPNDGIKILAIDGGGVRGLVALEILKKIESDCGKPAHQLFDYICGTSTGAIISFLIGLIHQSASVCQKDYESLSKAVFKRNLVLGTSMLFMNQSYFDTAMLEKIVKEKISLKQQLIQTTATPNTPRVAAIATLVSGHRPIPYIFRNYLYPPHSEPHYPGAYDVRPWEAVRASAAAPGYFEDYRIEGQVFQDGGLISNNPSAVAAHECKQLWPRIPIKCLVSLGTGYYYPPPDQEVKYDSSFSSKFKVIVDSATDTLKIHYVLRDMLPPSIYFRFNPRLSKPVTLHESRPEFLKQMQQDTQSYIRKKTNSLKNLQLILKDGPKSNVFSTYWKSFARWL